MRIVIALSAGLLVAPASSFAETGDTDKFNRCLADTGEAFVHTCYEMYHRAAPQTLKPAALPVEEQAYKRCMETSTISYLPNRSYACTLEKIAVREAEFDKKYPGARERAGVGSNYEIDAWLADQRYNREIDAINREDRLRRSGVLP